MILRLETKNWRLNRCIGTLCVQSFGVKQSTLFRPSSSQSKTIRHELKNIIAYGCYNRSKQSQWTKKGKWTPWCLKQKGVLVMQAGHQWISKGLHVQSNSVGRCCQAMWRNARIIMIMEILNSKIRPLHQLPDSTSLPQNRQQNPHCQERWAILWWNPFL